MAIRHKWERDAEHRRDRYESRNLISAVDFEASDIRFKINDESACWDDFDRFVAERFAWEVDQCWKDREFVPNADAKGGEDDFYAERLLPEDTLDKELEEYYSSLPGVQTGLGHEREDERAFIRQRRFVRVHNGRWENYKDKKGRKQKRWDNGLRRRKDHHHSTAHYDREPIEGVEPVNAETLAVLDSLSVGSQVMFQQDDGFHYCATKVSRWRLAEVTRKLKKDRKPEEVLRSLSYLPRRQGQLFTFDTLQSFYRKGYKRFNLVRGKQMGAQVNLVSDSFKIGVPDELRFSVSQENVGAYGFHFVREDYWQMSAEDTLVRPWRFAEVIDGSELVTLPDRGRTGLFRLPQIANLALHKKNGPVYEHRDLKEGPVPDLDGLVHMWNTAFGHNTPLIGYAVGAALPYVPPSIGTAIAGPAPFFG